jgi:hypothetical protein
MAEALPGSEIIKELPSNFDSLPWAERMRIFQETQLDFATKQKVKEEEAKKAKIAQNEKDRAYYTCIRPVCMRYRGKYARFSYDDVHDPPKQYCDMCKAIGFDYEKTQCPVCKTNMLRLKDNKSHKVSWCCVPCATAYTECYRCCVVQTGMHTFDQCQQCYNVSHPKDRNAIPEDRPKYETPPHCPLHNPQWNDSKPVCTCKTNRDSNRVVFTAS